MKIRLLTLTLLSLLLLSVTAYADLNIVESPHVDIVIDGEADTYVDTPLIVNDRTMLPLREVLTNLGVKNDDEHIIWNPDDRSVTIITDLETIWLQVDNTIAKVNVVALKLDVAPMIYSKNNRTYIPARFVSESLGKKVVWDGSTTTVLITDLERHTQVLDLLEKSRRSRVEEDYRLDLNYLLDITSEGEKTALDLDMSLIMNTQQDASYMKIGMGGSDGLKMGLSMEVYQLPDYTYSKTPFAGDSWLKSETLDQATANASFAADLDLNVFELAVNDIVAAGLIIVDKPDEDVIRLKGNVYLNELIDQSLALTSSEAEVSSLNIKKYYIDMVLDRVTYEMRSMDIDMDLSMIDEDGQLITIIAKVSVSTEKLASGYEITVPQEVLDNLFEF